MKQLSWKKRKENRKLVKLRQTRNFLKGRLPNQYTKTTTFKGLMPMTVRTTKHDFLKIKTLHHKYSSNKRYYIPPFSRF